MKNINQLLPILVTIGLGIAAFLYPTWIDNGYLDDAYPRIGAALAIYGGLIASIVWIVQNRK